MEFRILTPLLICLLVASCTKEVKIDIPGYTEKIVIDGRIETNMPPLVLISKTQDIYSPTTMDAFLNGFQSGAIITVSDGTNSIVLDEICTDNLPAGTETMAAAIFGISPSELANYHLCAYTTFNSVMFGQPGRTYSLKVELNGKTYTSSTQILQPKALDSVYWKQEASTPGFGYSWANLSDDASSFDSYMWEVKRINDVNGEDIDFEFLPTYTPVFNDEFFNGKSFNFYYENPFTVRDKDIPEKERGLYKQGDSVVVRFSRIDLNTYEFLEKKYMQLQTQGNPFAAPTSIPTNIQGGAIGLWGGFSTWFDTLYCHE